MSVATSHKKDFFFLLYKNNLHSEKKHCGKGVHKDTCVERQIGISCYLTEIIYDLYISAQNPKSVEKTSEFHQNIEQISPFNFMQLYCHHNDIYLPCLLLLNSRFNIVLLTSQRNREGRECRGRGQAKNVFFQKQKFSPARKCISWTKVVLFPDCQMQLALTC